MTEANEARVPQTPEEVDALVQANLPRILSSIAVAETERASGAPLRSLDEFQTPEAPDSV